MMSDIPNRLRSGCRARQAASGTALVSATLIAALITAGCGGPSGTPTPSASLTPASPATSVTSAQATAACANVTNSANALRQQATAYVYGQTAPVNVVAATQNLQVALGNASTALGPADAAQMNAAQQALQQLRSSLAAQPINSVAVHDNAERALSAVRDAVAICTPGSTPPVTTSIPAPATS